MDETWSPRTKIGKKVKEQEITNIDEILSSGHPILEPEVVDILIPDLKTETLSISTTQRVTDSGRKMKFKAMVIVGDGKDHVGFGEVKVKKLNLQ